MPPADMPVMSRPANRIDPLWLSTILITVCAVLVLPQPDSPTSATISPGPTEKLTPSTACTCSRGCRLSVPTTPRDTG